MPKTSTSCLYDFMFRPTKNAQVIQHTLLTHISSIQDADWFSLCGTFSSRNQTVLVCLDYHPIESNKDVLGLVVGSWAHFQFFQVGLGTNLLQ